MSSTDKSVWNSHAVERAAVGDTIFVAEPEGEPVETEVVETFQSKGVSGIETDDGHRLRIDGAGAIIDADTDTRYVVELPPQGTE